MIQEHPKRDHRLMTPRKTSVRCAVDDRSSGRTGCASTQSMRTCSCSSPMLLPPDRPVLVEGTAAQIATYVAEHGVEGYGVEAVDA